MGDSVKAAILAAVSMALSAAVFIAADKIDSKLEPEPTPIFHCVHGVSYVEFPAGVVVERSARGEIITCRRT